MGVEILQIKTNYEAERCRELVASLLASSGDPEEFQQILEKEMGGSAEEYVRVLSTAVAAFFVCAWPGVLDILKANKVDQESLIRILELRAQSAGDH
ncbi:MAG: hypothetical protein V7697_18565 [Rhodococcus erythropolis]